MGIGSKGYTTKVTLLVVFNVASVGREGRCTTAIKLIAEDGF
jgi:hypothetical protein